jgi:hypothetical protein
MLRSVAAAFALLLVTITTPADGISTPTAPKARPPLILGGPHSDGYHLQSLGFSRTSPSIVHAVVCCKICTVGKACGATCISHDKICHVGQGCACDG